MKFKIFCVEIIFIFFILLKVDFFLAYPNGNIPCRERKPMEKLELYNADGSKFEGRTQTDERDSNDGCPGRTYFEVEVLQHGNIAIEMKSGNDAIIYDGLLGDILETSTKLVLPGACLKTGSTLGVTTWTLKEKDDKPYSIINFALNGQDIGRRGLRLNGENVSAHVYIDPENADVKINLGSDQFKHDEGNIRINKFT